MLRPSDLRGLRFRPVAAWSVVVVRVVGVFLPKSKSGQDAKHGAYSKAPTAHRTDEVRQSGGRRVLPPSASLECRDASTMGITCPGRGKNVLSVVVNNAVNVFVTPLYVIRTPTTGAGLASCRGAPAGATTEARASTTARGTPARRPHVSLPAFVLLYAAIREATTVAGRSPVTATPVGRTTPPRRGARGVVSDVGLTGYVRTCRGCRPTTATCTTARTCARVTPCRRGGSRRREAFLVTTSGATRRTHEALSSHGKGVVVLATLVTTVAGTAGRIGLTAYAPTARRVAGRPARAAGAPSVRPNVSRASPALGRPAVTGLTIIGSKNKGAKDNIAVYGPSLVKVARNTRQNK